MCKATNLAILVCIVLGATNRIDAIGFGLDGLGIYLGMQEELFFNHTALDGRHREYPIEAMRDAFRVIERHLTREVDSKTLYANLEEVRRAISRELAAETPAGQSLSSRLMRKPPLSRQLVSKDVDLMLNSLMRLNDLMYISNTRIKCTIEITRQLDQLNQIADDPVGRRNRKEADIFPRIDSLILEVATVRAEYCIPQYKNSLAKLPDLFPRGTKLGLYWDKVFAYLMKNKYFAGKDIDRVYKKYPTEALAFVRDMPRVLDMDEKAIAVNFFDNKPAANNKKASPIEQPCVGFIDMVANTFESLDFDTQVLKYIPPDVETDYLFSRERAHYLMCKKPVEDQERFLRSLDQVAVA